VTGKEREIKGQFGCRKGEKKKERNFLIFSWMSAARYPVTNGAFNTTDCAWQMFEQTSKGFS